MGGKLRPKNGAGPLLLLVVLTYSAERKTPKKRELHRAEWISKTAIDFRVRFPHGKDDLPGEASVRRKKRQVRDSDA